MALHVGAQAPDFTLDSTSGDSFKLSNLKGKACILYFYPKDFTKGCTKESCDFRDHFQVFRSLDIDIYGISTDSVATHHKFKAKHKLPFELLADVSGKVSKLYKAHIPFVGISKRVTYLLNKNHTITAVYSDMFGAENHIKNMIEMFIISI